MNVQLLQEIQTSLASTGAKLVAVTKTYPPETIREAYALGCRDFGENRVQELLEKQPLLPPDVRWHLIGHLQTNKVRYIAPFVAMIHSVDSPRLLEEINKQAAKCGRVIDCLLQFHIAAEETKFGLSREEAADLLQNESFKRMPHARICGVMGMATFTDDEVQIRREFGALRDHFHWLQTTWFADRPEFREISMGMSGDWQIALEEGSTMVRIGSLLFGKRS
jgi:pyridoxal phosphate enzyme (YggS family)